jgi:hypothetical protein
MNKRFLDSLIYAGVDSRKYRLLFSWR